MGAEYFTSKKYDCILGGFSLKDKFLFLVPESGGEEKEKVCKNGDCFSLQS